MKPKYKNLAVLIMFSKRKKALIRGLHLPSTTSITAIVPYRPSKNAIILYVTPRSSIAVM